jgi:GntR family transcriptional regulator
MFLRLNPNSGLPLYRQMLQQLRERIASGALAPQAQLPSVRDLSADLQVNPLTVAKVYQLLEQDGLVEFRRGQGTFVAAGRKPLSAAAQQKLIQPALDQLISEARHLGLSEAQLQQLIHQTYAQRK